MAVKGVRHIMSIYYILRESLTINSVMMVRVIIVVGDVEYVQV